MPVRKVRRKRASGWAGPRNDRAGEEFSRALHVAVRIEHEVAKESIPWRGLEAVECALASGVPEVDLEIADKAEPVPLLRRPRADAWSAEDDERIRAAWVTSWPQDFVFEFLAKCMGRTLAAVKTRGYSLGLRKWAPEQRAAFHQRAADRRKAIDECLRTGGRREELAQRLGIDPSLIQHRRGDLVWAGENLPEVARWSWGLRQNQPEVWKAIANAAYAAYRDTAKKMAHGGFCACYHQKSEHLIEDFCVAVDANGDVCACTSFRAARARISKSDIPNMTVMHRESQRGAQSLDAMRAVNGSGDGSEYRLEWMLAAQPPADPGEIAECIRDDHERFAHMGYIAWPQVRNPGRFLDD